MAYDEELQLRIQRAVTGRAGVTEKKMFGGVCFLLDGKMFCGIVKDEMMVRVGPAAHEAALAEPHVRPMDFTGRLVKGMVFVEPGGLHGAALRERGAAAAALARTLPPKPVRQSGQSR